MDEILELPEQLFDIVLFSIGNTPITIWTLLTVAAVIVITFWVSKLMRRLAERALSHRSDRPGLIGTITGLIHYAVLVLGFGVALDTAGIDLTALFAAGAIFAVGLGFAMQSIAENFVAGVILLTERAIKPGDILEVEGRVVRVVEMGIRASIGRTRDGEDLIIPNSTLIQTTVTNYTLRSRAIRIRVPVGVVYSSYMKHVRRTLEAVAAELTPEWSDMHPAPRVFVRAFGESSVDWELAIWIDDAWELRPAHSRVHEAIWEAFQREGIVIAFPQVDLHLDPPVMRSIERLATGRVA